MKYQELKPDIELGQDLKPEIMPIGLFLSKNLHWFAGITSFCGLNAFVLYLFHIWPSSPLLYIIGFICSLIASIIMLIIGIIVLLFTADSFVIKNITELYCLTTYQTLSSIILSIIGSFYLIRLFIRSRLSEPMVLIIICISIIILLMLLVIRQPNYFTIWVANFTELVISLFSKTS